jgi:hypothetical protein
MSKIFSLLFYLLDLWLLANERLFRNLDLIFVFSGMWEKQIHWRIRVIVCFGFKSYNIIGIEVKWNSLFAATLPLYEILHITQGRCIFFIYFWFGSVCTCSHTMFQVSAILFIFIYGWARIFRLPCQLSWWFSFGFWNIVILGETFGSNEPTHLDACFLKY